MEIQVGGNLGLSDEMNSNFSAAAMSRLGSPPLPGARGTLDAPNASATNKGGTASDARPFEGERLFFNMLPDYLEPGLDVVFIGINPGTYSNRAGHYFARPTNLFWSALFQASLVSERLTPQDDARLIEFGYGLTDLVARPTANIDELTAEEFVRGGESLRQKIIRFAPRIACFVGIVGYRAAYDRNARLGAQSSPGWGNTQIFIVPSTSPRNAYYRPRVVDWFKQLKQFRDELTAQGERHP